jgi:hypothetical protein
MKTKIDVKQQVNMFFANLNVKYIFLLTLVFIGCKNYKNAEQVDTIDIESIKQEIIKLTDLKNEFRVICLETIEESLIQYIKKVILNEKRIYILDNQLPTLAVFNEDGSFIMNIGKHGNGPGEYYFPSDFIIDKKNNLIEIYDGLRKRILKYDLDGNFIDKTEVPELGHYFIKFSDGSYLVHTNMTPVNKPFYKLFRMNKLGEIISQELEYTSATMQSTRCPFVDIGDDNYIFSESLCDTIYRITKKRVEPWININSGNESIPHKFRVDIVQINNISKKYSRKWGSPMFHHNKLIIKYMSDWNPKYFVYDIKNQPIYYRIVNNYDYAFATPDFSSDNQLIGIINPTSLNLHKSNPRYELAYRTGLKISEFEDLRKTINITDNPCLILWDIEF